MNEPKPEQEWTVERVAWFVQEYGAAWQIKIVDEINAALAAGRETKERVSRLSHQYYKDYLSEREMKLRYYKETDQLRSQLAAQQRYIDEIRTTTYSDLEQQLAAEREKAKEAEWQRDSALRQSNEAIAQLRSQLVALVDALKYAQARIVDYFAIHKIRGFSKRTSIKCAKETIDAALAKVREGK